MNQTYTAYIPVDDIDEDDLVIARNLSGAEAMKIAFGHRDGWNVHVDETDHGWFMHYQWRAHPNNRPPDRSWTERLQATVIRSGDAFRDKAVALEMIAAQFLRQNQNIFWSGRIEADHEFDERLRRVAEKREVRRIDKEISTRLVDALLADGYTITCDLMEDDPEFKRSIDRNGILEHMWQVEIVEMHVHKGKSQAWLRLTFDESGWDLIQDYSEKLGYLIDPIVEKYLPMDQTDSEELDGGIRVLVLESPDDVLKIGEMLK
ncbi:hypothetical protein [Bradyrhizobium elkanii]|uniref:hypothetical protein n=1 Tax=Bradyrhizobium elkanii TaxID=29448 RepID=UPI0004AFA34A|nr:hypothetical protein [Bradyrhizobium elkanii]WLA83209.1 hypothetical protein QNJ99_02375 [Bradyrhizobium elkanii]